MTDLSDLRLGCYIPEVPKPAIQFAEIVAPREGSGDAPDEHGQWEPLDLAYELDYLAPFESWNVLGNNRYNDCVSVTWANMRRLITSKLSGSESYPNMYQVMQLYKTQVKDGNPDKGMGITEVLEWLVGDNNHPDGVRAIAFAEVKVKMFDQVREALAIFGALWIELLVDQQNKEEFDYQQTWTVPLEPDGFGHSVLCGGCTKDGKLKIVTWGKTAVLDADFVQKRIKRAFVVVWPEHLGSRRFTRGVDMERLRTEFKKFTGRDLPLSPKKLNSVLVTHEDRKREYLQILKIEPDQKLGEDQWYNTETIRTLTPITVRNALNAILAIDNDDLYLIRIKDTPSNYVEIQRVLGPQYYDLESTTPNVTAFKCRNSETGVFCIDNGDLYFIKLPKTGASSQKIEVHWAPHEKRFQSVTKYITGFELPSNFDSKTDRVVISGGDLYLLVKGRDHLEVHCARGYSNYSAATVAVTGIPLDEISKFLTIGLNGDLYMIKHSNTDNGKVEVWISRPAENNYRQVQKYTTMIDADEIPNVKASTIAERRWLV